MILFSQITIALGLTTFAYFSWRKIEWGIYFIIFFLPAYLIKTSILGIPTTLLELAIYILFIIWLVKNYRLPQIKESLSGIFPSRLFALGVFLLMIGVFTSTALSVDLRASSGILKGWFLDPFLFFIVLASTVKTYDQKLRALFSLFASGAVVGIASLIYCFFPSLGGISYDGRLHAFYSSPNYLAMYLAPALLIGIWALVSSECFLGSGKKFFEGKHKYFWLISSAIILAAIYLTFSYAAWVALAFSLLLLVCSILRIRGQAVPIKKKIIFFVLVIFAFSAMFLSEIGKSKFENLEKMAYRSSYNSRLMIWRSAWAIGKDNPLWGIGPGNFQRYYLDYQKRFTEPYLEWAVPQPHNIFLAFWLQSGFLGLAGFVILILWFFKKCFGLLKKTGEADYQKLAVILFAMMAYTLLHGFVDTTYWKNDLAIIFWLFTGLMVGVPEKNES